MPDSNRPLVRDGIQYKAMDDGAILYDPANDRVHSLNAAAAFIWNSCDGQRTLDGISGRLQELASISDAQAARDVREAISKFREEGLLKE